ncbi:oxygen-insensitive NADPH nitroreductase [Anaeromicrobium sediminis]|uniref:Nitroreductase A n=1 Tax=Anaeromicrobium sediminis TaxID=1478221 RepID=A0A267MGY0_9FIRM|nr:oxygen-insensitive NADPH nitroreductase [Anaeromicrobium sediminis]PAB58050.1 nitroreductase A [Anaeromicrobium sediminis]
MNEVIKLLKSHRSIRKFQDKRVEEEKIKMIIESAQCASTSSFVQAYTIIRVEDMDTRKEIAKLSGDQIYVEKCPLFLVFCADLNRLDLACKMNNTHMIEGYTEPLIIGTVDAALAAQNTMVAAESMGLGGVYIGGIRNDPYKVCDLLNIPKNVYPLFGMCLGYPNQDPEIKPRLPLDVVFKEEKYSTEGDEEKIKEYDKVISEYYLKRTRGKRDDSWSKQMAEKMGNELRPHMREFLKSKGFEMK